MTFDCPDDLKRAIAIRAAATGMPPSDLLVSVLTDLFHAELALAREHMKHHPPEKSRRGRKPKDR